MLAAMRNNIKKLSITLWLVIASFILTIFLVWGKGSLGTGGASNIVATVEGKEIHQRELQMTRNRLYNFYRNLYKDKFTEDLVKNLNLERMALESLIEKELLLAEAEKRGMKISEEELLDTITKYQVFQKDGKFDPDQYKFVLLRSGITPQEFEESIQEDLLIQKLEAAIQDGIKVSDKEVELEYRLQNEKVKIEYVAIKPSTFQKDVTVTDEEIARYYEDHKEDFKTPDRVRVNYLYIDPQTFTDQVTVEESEIQDYFDQHRDQFPKEKRIKARHILFKIPPGADPEKEQEVKKKAEEVLQKIKEGADFAAMARQYSEEPGAAENGGDLGYFTKGKMVEPFEKAAFSLKKGEVSDLVRTEFGYHIIKVEDVLGENPYEEAKPGIQTILKREKAQEVARQRADEVYQKALETKDLKQAAEATGLPLKTSNLFARMEPVGPEMGILIPFQEAAFTLSPGEISQVVEVPGAGFYILQLVEKKDSYIPSLEEAREQVKEKIIDNKATELAEKKANEFLAELKAGASWESLLEKYQLTPVKPEPFNRRWFLNDMAEKSEEIIHTAFSLEVNQVSDPIKTPGGFVLLKVVEKPGIDEKKFQEEKENLRRSLLQQKQSTAYREFIEELKKKANIKPPLNQLLQSRA
ncbi:MAG TPA: peptidylprolyl isomerase [Candidatus Limnocylindrales bacterium]|nr:peptidylprolyl isomerase [Candidatus Limnocylindrales bacterium]